MKNNLPFEQMMRIFDMALDFLSIDSSKKENIVRVLEEKFQEHSDISVTEIFKQENLISDEEIEYVRIFDAHLKTVSLDQHFGRLAIANGLTSEKEVALALNHQKIYFEKYRIHTKIGDILVENKRLSPGDQVSILLTQNRIKDENLSGALNQIGATLRQQDMINKQFGVLAIKKELVTIKQVNTALAVQKDEKQTQGEIRFIGQILQETAHLSDEDIMGLLLEQKQFEKRRLDLEKALYTIKSEIKISNKFNKIFEYQVSRDGLEVFVKKRIEIKEIMPVYEFLIWLRRSGIKFGVVSDAVLETFIQTAEKESHIIAAKGQPAKPSINESLQFYFESDSFCIVKKGSFLARIIPGEKGKPGKNVLGHTILPAKPSICVLNAGSGVIKKGPVFIARIDGHPILKNNTLRVEPMVEKTDIKTINGSISTDTKEMYESETVFLKGGITRGAILRCHSLSIQGDLLGQVICTGDIDVKGSVGTDEQTKEDQSIRQTGIICQGSVKVSKSIIHSKIQTAGELSAFNSTVTGSEVIAAKDISISAALKGNHTPSVFRFGLKPEDKIIATDHTLEMKNEQLSVLKREMEISRLTQEYQKELKEEAHHQMEQAILKNLVEIIEAPELYRYERLEEKISYLNRLPDFSSIKAYYFKPAKTDMAQASFNQIVGLTEKMSLGKVLQQIKKKIDLKLEDENANSRRYEIETQFKSRLAVFEQEIADGSEEIEKLENEIKGLEALKTKLGEIYFTFWPQFGSVRIKNRCEKGTIIKGRIARRVVEKTIYNVRFKEVMDPKTHTASIVIEIN
jgi:uncharacterized protein (DUF342 family)